MLDAGLHPARGDAPLSRLEVNLGPGRSSRLAGPCRGQDSEPQTEFGSRGGPRRVHGRQGCRDIAVGQSTEVLLYGRLGRQGAVDGVACDVVLDVTVGLTPRQCGANAPSKLARLLRFAGPQWSEDSQHVLAADAVDAHVAEDRECVSFERGRPVLVGLWIAPARPVRLDGLFGRFAEGRDPGFDLLGERIPSVGDGDAVGEGSLPCLGETNDREAAQTDVVPSSVYGDSLNPALRTAALDAQIECVAVAVPAGPGERFRLGECQSCHVVPTSVPTL